jgi:hypothetical protein
MLRTNPLILLALRTDRQHNFAGLGRLEPVDHPGEMVRLELWKLLIHQCYLEISLAIGNDITAILYCAVMKRAGALTARLLVSIIACGGRYTTARVASASVASRMVWYTTVRNLRL